MSFGHGPRRVLSMILCLGVLGCGAPGGTPETRLKRVQDDLDNLRYQVTLYDAQNKALTGSSWQPLIDKGMLKEIPLDPWGRPYILDTTAATITTLGADGKPGGTGEDADSFLAFRVIKPKQ